MQRINEQDVETEDLELPEINQAYRPGSRPAVFGIGDPYKVGQRLGERELALNSLEGLPAPKPQPPPRAWRASMRGLSKRISLTPSEMPYPSALFRQNDPVKAEQVLGLRPFNAPPVPPKTPSTIATHQVPAPLGWHEGSRSSKSTLPIYKEPLSPTLVSEPLNGRTAWLHAATAVLVVFNCWGLSNAFGLLQAYYEQYHLKGTSPSTIAWIGSTQLALVFGLGVPVGRLVDRGYFRLIFHSGSFVMVLGIFVSSFCNVWWSLWLVQGLLTGLGMGMVFGAGILALMTWFDEKKIGVAMGLGAAGSCIGGIVYVLLAGHFLATNGFATTMRILGGVAAITMIPPNLVFKMRGQTHKLRPRTGARHPGTKMALHWRTFTDTSYLLAAAGMFFTFMGVYFGFVYMVSYGSQILKLDNTAATNLLIYMLTANLPGRFLPALISDKCIGPLNTIIPAAMLSSVIVWLWTASYNNQISLIVTACFYGFFSAGVQVLYAPTVYTFCLETSSTSEMNTKDTTQLAMDRMGIKAGGIFTCIGLACLVGTPIGGALISYRTDRHLSHPYLGAQIFAGACLMLGGSLLLASRVARVCWAAKRA